ncbi:L-selectin-like [Myxocyprinus asiaticus]|uniref:L-selectin-like n=1 Tax=Myxocyprinus asiaticus TaxID=70543 RepID=UPI0022221C3E|nr:L-selectin-like [Myxocyprinus asiaticus]
MSANSSFQNEQDFMGEQMTEMYLGIYFSSKYHRSDSTERRLKKTMTGGVLKLRATFGHIGLLMMYLRVILVYVDGWTYSYSNKTMSWNNSRKWCQTNYTDVVMVHNENVTRFLINNLPQISGSYYWIGIKKIDGIWTWVANGQVVDYQPWAINEPNNVKSNENCVEMYISISENNGKWNDEGCEKEKLPICQKAQCLNNSCSDREDCFEQVNNFTCTCKPGLSGPRCETAVSCEKLSAPQHGWMDCAGFYGNHSLNSTCTFFCASGYKLSGTAELKCNSSGAWNAPPPSCAVECYPLLLFGGGLMNCSEGHDTYRSTCRVQCPPGHLLLGFAEFSCRADGTWVSSFPLMCANYVHFLWALLGCFGLSMFCCCLLCCSKCRKSRKAVRSRTQQETINQVNEAEHTPLEGPACSA